MTGTSMQERDLPTIAVGAVIWNARGEVLLIKRAREPRLGEWSIPGGKVIRGESLRDALMREVREETGLKIEIVGLIDVVDFIAPPHHYVLIDFTARWISGEPRAGDDAQDARWVPLNELDRYELWSETRRVIAQSAQTLPKP